MLKRTSHGLAALAMVPVLNRCGTTGAAGDGLPDYDYTGELGPETLFADGIASGDPLSNAIILWTRINPVEGTTADIDVFIELSTDSSFANRLSAQSYPAKSERSYCLKVDAVDLSPGTTYYYRFSALGRTSAIGRTRTAPAADNEHLRLAVCACSNYAYGYFHGYGHLAKREDIDAVLHLGDYIYEYGNGQYGGVRDCEPSHEIRTLENYRARYSQYRRDPDLQEVHRQFPWITVWDDHEFCDDPYPGGADNHQPEEDGNWEERVAIATRVYDEWMPTRVDDVGKIWRTFNFGNLAHIHAIDIKRPLVAPVEGEEQTMLGEEQATWLDAQIANTRATWMLLAQQQTFTPPSSAWDSHPASRDRIKAAMEAAGVTNLIVLTGDIHQARACDITSNVTAYDLVPGAQTWGVEVVCSSITSPGSTSDLSAHPHKLWSEGLMRGYIVLDLTPARAQADWFGFSDILKGFADPPREAWFKGYATQTGDNHLIETAEPAAAKTNPPPMAPS
jgi:alkaline phosphatase D